MKLAWLIGVVLAAIVGAAWGMLVGIAAADDVVYCREPCCDSL